jgi:hypothetical protein
MGSLQILATDLGPAAIYYGGLVDFYTVSRCLSSVSSNMLYDSRLKLSYHLLSDVRPVESLEEPDGGSYGEILRFAS